MQGLIPFPKLNFYGMWVFLKVKRNEYEWFSSMTRVHKINKEPPLFHVKYFMLCSKMRRIKGWNLLYKEGWVHSQQGVSYINGRSQIFLLKVTQGTCNNFCIVCIVRLPKHGSEVWFCFPLINLSEIQQKEKISDKLLHLLLSS